MANANKRKGDRAERAVRDWAVARYADSFKTRAGFNDDIGDVLVTHPAGLIVLQVKDVASPAWSTWFNQLHSQVTACLNHVRGTRRVLGGVIVHKRRGSANPGNWRVVTTLDDMDTLITNAYAAGYLDASD